MNPAPTPNRSVLTAARIDNLVIAVDNRLITLRSELAGQRAQPPHPSNTTVATPATVGSTGVDRLGARRAIRCRQINATADRAAQALQIHCSTCHPDRRGHSSTPSWACEPAKEDS